MKVLITCPPMILRIEQCKHLLSDWEITIPKFTQTMSEESLIEIISEFDAWIAGDDPVTRKVLEKSNLKCLIKWGIGTDNIDFDAIKDLQIPFSNTPGMFGNEVANVAIGYLLALTRNLFQIDREVRKGNWFKPSGISLTGRKVGLVGFGDIGRNIARRLLSLRMKVWVSDPGFENVNGVIMCKYNPELKIELLDVIISDLQSVLQNSDILILSCPANTHTYHILNDDSINLLSDNCYIINVSRGSVVNENSVINALKKQKISGFATDVFEIEPINLNNELLGFDNVIVGSHNASNTVDAVDTTNIRAIKLLSELLPK